MCWLLKDLLSWDHDNFPSVVLPGVHTTFFPWVPPPGIPDGALLRLRAKLLRVVKYSMKLPQQRKMLDIDKSLMYDNTFAGVLNLMKLVGK